MFAAACALAAAALAVAWIANPRATRVSNAKRHSEPPLSPSRAPISAADFYGQYHGHPLRALDSLHAALRDQNLSVAWLAGDSSLDNKHWLGGSPVVRHVALQRGNMRHTDCGRLPAAYAPAFEPGAIGLEDVAHHLAHALAVAGSASTAGSAHFGALNCAVEESTLYDRESELLAHDTYVRDHIKAGDVLVVSVGGNDIGLHQSLRTLVSVGVLSRLPVWLIERLPAWALGNMRDLFGTQLERYVGRLTERTRPRAVIVCMYYYPSLAGSGWPDPVLRALGYEATPQKLQRVIDTLFERVTRRIQVAGVRVVPVALARVLDCTQEGDYVQRVEPSSQGGRKMAARFAHEIASLID